MYVRLAFSVAVHIEPEILIIDEALAVGDIRFQMKCLKHMEKLKGQGTTILFVSHSPEQVKRFCNKAIWLDKGIIKKSGTSSAVCDQYKDYMSRGEKQENEQELISRQSNNLSLPIRITSTSLDKRELQPTESLTLTIEYEIFDEIIPDLLVGAAIYSSGRDYIFGPNTSLEGINVPNEKGKHMICYKIPSLPLLPGSFSFDVGVFTDKGLVTLDYLSMAEEFYVVSDYISEGIMYIKHEWDIVS